MTQQGLQKGLFADRLAFPDQAFMNGLYLELKETAIAEYLKSEAAEEREVSWESDKVEWPIDSDGEDVVRKAETVKPKPPQNDIVIPKKVASLYSKSNYKAVSRQVEHRLPAKDPRLDTRSQSNKLWSVVGTATAGNSVPKFSEFQKAKEAAEFVTSLTRKKVESVIPSRKRCLEEAVPERAAKIREQAVLISQNRRTVKEVSSKAVSVLKKHYEQKTKLRSQQIARLEEKKNQEMMASLKAVRKRYDPQEVVW